MSFILSDLKDHNSKLLNLLTKHLPDMLWVKDINGVYLYANKAICDGLLMAKDTEEPLGKTDVFFATREREAHKEIPNWHTFGELCFNSDQIVIDNNKPMRFEEYGNVKGKLLYLEVFKAPFYDKDGNIIGTVGAGRDITDLKHTQSKLEESLQTLQEQRELLSYQANHDPLTDLPNRTLFLDRLSQSIKYADQYDQSLAVLFIDLDNFKEINDSLGHSVGDKVLIETTRRMSSLMNKTDSLARLGGDEFSIILNNTIDRHTVEEKIETYMDVIKQSFLIDDNTLHVSMSIGIAMYPEDGKNVHDLLQFSDAAMYQAKMNGRDTYSFYNEQMTQNAYEKIMIETELRKAFHEDQLEVYYQPQIDANTNQLVGMEALVRWHHPSLGMIYPERFISLAESNGMILELDKIVIHKAISQFYEWHRDGLHPVKISMNLSMKQIEENDFLDFLKELMSHNNYHYEDLEFEVTETQIMNNPELSIQTLRKISELGISLAVDDFGTGYSSLAYLKRLPINKLKIDKSFVDGLPDDSDDMAISKTIIDLCNNLGLDVLAEGVETDAQKQFLQQHGCHTIQGHLYSPALSTAEMRKYLRERMSQ